MYCVRVYFVLIVTIHFAYRTNTQDISSKSITTVCNYTNNAVLAEQRLPANKVSTIASGIQAFKRAILRRKTRFIVFPKRSVTAITLSLIKSILGGIPRGTNFAVELDTITAVPDSLEAWQPTVLLKRVKSQRPASAIQNLTTMHASQPTLPTLSFNHEPHMENGEENWSSPFDYHDYVDQDFHYPGHYSHHYYDESPILPDLPHGEPSTAEFIRKLYSAGVSQKPKFPNERFRFSQQSLPERLHSQHILKKPDSFYDEIFNVNAKNPTERKTKTDEQDDQHVFYKSWNPDFHPNWKYSNSYRERRDIFEKLEAIGKLFQFNIKACIQRSMCELRNSLKPFGKSLMEDILRIILTTPHRKGHGYYYDLWNKPATKRNCAHLFRKSCPHKIIDYFNLPAAKAKQSASRTKPTYFN